MVDLQLSGAGADALTAWHGFGLLRTNGQKFFAVGEIE